VAGVVGRFEFERQNLNQEIHIARAVTTHQTCRGYASEDETGRRMVNWALCSHWYLGTRNLFKGQLRKPV